MMLGNKKEKIPSALISHVQGGAGNANSEEVGCDFLQEIFDGCNDISHYTGWRDQINAKAASMLYDLTIDLMSLGYCRSLVPD